MNSNWTTEQARAIHARANDICVSAGAGSGKTGVLVERFVRIVHESLRESLPPEERAGVGQILVITFTDKATREMKSRIVDALNRLDLRNERREVETAYISTIHGFCSRILKENPFEAGLDPAFTVLDENEARRTLRACLEDALELSCRGGQDPVMDLVAAMQNARIFGADARDPLSTLAKSAEHVLGALRSVGRVCADIPNNPAESAAAVSESARQLLTSVLEPAAAEFDRALQLLRARRATGLAGSRQDKVLAAMETARPWAEAATWPQTTAALRAMCEALKSAGKPLHPGPRTTAQEQEVLYALQAISNLDSALRPFDGVTAESEETAALLGAQFLRLLRLLWERYDSAKRALGVVDNDDLQTEAVRLLESAPAMRRAYRRRFRHLLVDEFQDTNPLQMRLIDLLHAPDEDGRYPNSLFLVGDSQQSIYGFRNAEPAIFRNIEERIRADSASEHVTLAANFRSRPEILAFVNFVFDRAWTQCGAPFTPLTPGANHASKPQPSIEFMVGKDCGGPAPYAEVEAAAMAARINRMVREREVTITDRHDARCGRPVEFGDVALLLRGILRVEIYERAFFAAGLPYFVVGGGRGYYARWEIRDVLNALTVLDNPLDDLALIAALRSPMAGLSADTLFALAKFARESGGRGAPIYPAIPAYAQAHAGEECGRLTEFYNTTESLRAVERLIPAGQILERLVTATNYDARLLMRPNGRRRLANLRKLLQIAHSGTVHGVRDFIQRLRDLEKVTEREGDAPTEEEGGNVVRILTIHKAKGLEFPVVFLGDMGRGPNRNRKSIFLADPDSLAVGCRSGDNESATFTALASQSDARNQEESLRVLYVALTRAREHLVLCGHIPRLRGGNTWSEAVFLQAAVMGVPGEEETRGADGWQARTYSQASLL